MNENYKINWKAIISGFIVTLILFPFLDVIAPIIGGVVAGYFLEGNIKMEFVMGESLQV